MLSDDERSKWDARIIHDSRVISFWDGSRVVGKLFAKITPSKNPFGAQWDACYVYGPEADWSGPAPAPLVAWGRTIFNNRKKLQEALDTLIKGSGQ